MELHLSNKLTEVHLTLSICSYGNVAAGGDHSGFWFETPGERALIDLGAFDGNSAHSMAFFGFTTYPPGWQPIHKAHISHLNVYRNMRSGMFLHVTRNLHFSDLLVADNGWHGVWILQGDSVTFKNAKIIGVSSNAIGKPPHCGSFGALGKGMVLHAEKLQELDNTGTITGTILMNVEFINFSPEASGCAEGSAAISFSSSHLKRATFDAPHHFSNVTLEEGVAPIDVYPLEAQSGLDDIIIEIVEDPKGSFSIEAQPGFLLSPKFSVFVADKPCRPYSNRLDFCPQVCMRTVRFLTNSVADNYDMVVSDGANNTLILKRKQRHNSLLDRRFDGIYNAALPAGKFEVYFEDGKSLRTFPDYVIPVLEAAPVCINHIERDGITVLRPDPRSSACGDLIKNGNFDIDITNGRDLQGLPGIPLAPGPNKLELFDQLLVSTF